MRDALIALLLMMCSFCTVVKPADIDGHRTNHGGSHRHRSSPLYRGGHDNGTDARHFRMARSKGEF